MGAPRAQHLALGLLVLAFALATVAAKQTMLVDRLLGSSENVQAASAQPASYDDTKSVCFKEIAACE
jgi:hypothetical protein